ncbi:hypothetical protein RE0327_36490 [Prescottella equi]|nr:hypothetical protein RE0327_36490 [Prescottella equi]
MPTSRSTDRRIPRPTNESGPTPSAISNRAVRRTRDANPAYDSASPSNTTATASGVRATCASNRSTNVASGTGRDVAFHSPTTNDRSTSSSRSMSPTTPDGRVTTEWRIRANRSPKMHMVDASNRSVA